MRLLSLISLYRFDVLNDNLCARLGLIDIYSASVMGMDDVKIIILQDAVFYKDVIYGFKEIREIAFYKTGVTL